MKYLIPALILLAGCESIPEIQVKDGGKESDDASTPAVAVADDPETVDTSEIPAEEEEEPETETVDLTDPDNHRYEIDWSHKVASNGLTTDIVSYEGLQLTMDFDAEYYYVTYRASYNAAANTCQVTHKIRVVSGQATSVENICPEDCENSYVAHRPNGSQQTNLIKCPNTNLISNVPFGLEFDNATLDLTFTYPSDNPTYPTPAYDHDYYTER